MIDGPLGTVRVVYHDPIAHSAQAIRRALKGLRRLLGHQSDRLLVAVDALADKIVIGIIAEIELHVFDHIRQRHKARRVVGVVRIGTHIVDDDRTERLGRRLCGRLGRLFCGLFCGRLGHGLSRGAFGRRGAGRIRMLSVRRAG